MADNESHSAPGQAAGYLYQIERAMARLAEVDVDAVVAVEKEDDVSVRFADGQFYLEQDKHTLSDRCPFGDNSKALWRTLDIWTDLVERKEIEPQHGRYFLVTNVTIPDGLAQTICDADAATLKACLKKLNDVATDVPDTVKAIVGRVMGRKTALESIVPHIECIDASADSFGPGLRRQTSSKLHLPEDIEEIDVLNNLHGWIANELMTAWRDGKPGLIPRRSFDRQVHRLIEQFRRFKRFGFPAHMVDFAKEDVQRHRKRTYVKQIAIVTPNVNETIEAITDYLRCSNERFRLANEGALTDDDWIQFEDDLMRSWDNIFRRETRLRTDEPEDTVGYKVLCDTRDVTAALGGSAAYPYLVMGTYHRFADGKKIGWHPRYATLIK
ncbi:MAG: hypothetical protein MI757_21125 [Pirellulales bacterium]|nr:hypothetical protein [Pirellulales bacterium]